VGALVVGTATVTMAHAAVIPEPTIDHIVSAHPDNVTPNVNDGRVDGMVQVGNRIIAVGKFTSVTAGEATFTRNSIFAFNATTGALVTAGKAPVVNSAVNDLQLTDHGLYIGGGFTTVGGQARTLLAELSPVTGGDTGVVNFAFSDPWNGGALGMKRFDISTSGSTPVAVGNFRSVDGLSRQQIMMADLSPTTALLSSWSSDRYDTPCAGVFDTYMRDVDIAPSGAFFAVAATGAYSGGVGSGTLCDSISRCELAG
jgi:hypothetical protein